MKNKLVIFISLIILTACGTKTTDIRNDVEALKENSLRLTDGQIKSAGITIGKAEKRNISSVLRLNGKIDVPPQNMVSVSMPLGGFLKSSKLLPGMHVKKGEMIAEMEDQTYIQLQQEYLMAKSKLLFAENEYNRQKELNTSKATSDKVFQQTEMEYKNHKIMVSALAEKLRLISINPDKLNESNLSRSAFIYSTIDGFVSKVNVNIGKYVNPSDVIFELINPTDIHLNLKVFEKDLDKLSIGQKLVTYNNNQPDRKYQCEVILISQDLSVDRSAEVHCHFVDYNKTLLPGMYMNAEVEITINKVVSVNEDAIVNYEGKDFVFVSKGSGYFEMLEIIKGDTENGFTQINSKENVDLLQFQFVVKGAYSILMQLKNKLEE